MPVAPGGERASSGLKQLDGLKASRTVAARFRSGGNVHMRAYLTISGTLFAILAVLHLIRLLTHWPALIAGLTVPVWVSAVGLVVAGGLTLWAGRLARRLPRDG